MAFNAGRITYCRFFVTGDAPASVDDTALDILREFAFRESDIGAPDEVEAGFITGDHLLDTQFSYDKNGFGDLLLFALRIDTHKVPSDIKHAYQRINEQAAAAASATGFTSKKEKREAKDLAGRQIQEDLAAGKFRRSRAVPVLWDLSRKVLYCGNAGTMVIEQISRLMRESFAVDLDIISAGSLTGRLLRDQGKGRDYEDLKPSAFTDPPARATEEHDDADGPRDISVPLVPWTVQSVDLKDFLGNEFLIWLWWLQETHEGAVKIQRQGRADEAFITLSKVLDTECAWDVLGRQALRADGPTALNEAAEALATGKWPRKVGMLLSDGEHQWELTLQGDKLVISAAQLPEVEDVQHPRELLDARLSLMRQLDQTIDAMFTSFLQQRVGGSWPGIRQQIRQWIQKRRPARIAAASSAAAPAVPTTDVVADTPQVHVVADAIDMVSVGDRG